VSQQREEASSEFVIPNLDLVIVATGDDKGLVKVKIHATNGAVVLFESVYDRAYAVVPPDICEEGQTITITAREEG
jgi:hypothetical protein